MSARSLPGDVQTLAWAAEHLDIAEHRLQVGTARPDPRRLPGRRAVAARQCPEVRAPGPRRELLIRRLRHDASKRAPKRPPSRSETTVALCCSSTSVTRTTFLRVWSEVDRVLTIRGVDPELRQDIERLLPLLAGDTAEEVASVLDELEPTMILRLFFDELREASVEYLARKRASRAA